MIPYSSFFATSIWLIRIDSISDQYEAMKGQLFYVTVLQFVHQNKLLTSPATLDDKELQLMNQL